MSKSSMKHKVITAQPDAGRCRTESHLNNYLDALREYERQKAGLDRSLDPVVYQCHCLRIAAEVGL